MGPIVLIDLAVNDFYLVIRGVDVAIKLSLDALIVIESGSSVASVRIAPLISVHIFGNYICSFICLN